MPRLTRPETRHSRARRKPPQLIRQKCGPAAGMLPLPVGEGRGEGPLLRGALASHENTPRPPFPGPRCRGGLRSPAGGLRRWGPFPAGAHFPVMPRQPLTPTLSLKGRESSCRSTGRQAGEGPLLPKRRRGSPRHRSPVLPATKRCRKDREPAGRSEGERGCHARRSPLSCPLWPLCHAAGPPVIPAAPPVIPPAPPLSFPPAPLCHSRRPPSVIPAVVSGNPVSFSSIPSFV